MRQALGELESLTRQITGPDWLRSDGSWADINYNETPGGGWGPWEHTRRLIVMAKAYRTPGQALYRNTALLAQIDAALAYTKTFYGSTVIPTGNWWFWTIGIPIDLAPTLVLMQGEVNPQTHDDLVRASISASAAPHRPWDRRSGADRGEPGLVVVHSSLPGPAAERSGDDGRRSRRHGRRDQAGHRRGNQARPVVPSARRTALHRRLRRVVRQRRGALRAPHGRDLVRAAGRVAFFLYRLRRRRRGLDALRQLLRRLGDQPRGGPPDDERYNGIAAPYNLELDTPRNAEIRAAAAKMLATWNGTMPRNWPRGAKVEASRFPRRGLRSSPYFASDYTCIAATAGSPR